MRALSQNCRQGRAKMRGRTDANMTHTPSSAPVGASALAVDPSPTPYAALNVVLDTFVGRARELLADNFIGAYLQGSFALGDLDEKSDVDFVIAVARDIADADVPALN